MITTVIFDYGNTLVRFREDELARSYTDSEEDAAKIEQIFFDRFYWSRLDEGTLTHEDWIEDAAKKLPEHLHALLPEIANSWYYRLPEIDGMHDLVVDLKNQYGVKLVLLSNIADYFADHISEFPILSHFDGYVLSGVCKRVKPRPEIFAYLCEQFDLVPSETVFVDDNPANIAGARDFGINAYLFDGDSARLRAYLDQVIEKK